MIFVALLVLLSTAAIAATIRAVVVDDRRPIPTDRSRAGRDDDAYSGSGLSQ